jgi:hypothetical protein
MCGKSMSPPYIRGSCLSHPSNHAGLACTQVEPELYQELSSIGLCHPQKGPGNFVLQSSKRVLL